MTKRQAAGTATDYDVLAAQVAVENAKPAVIRSQNIVRAAREQLRFLLAETHEVDVEGTLATAVEPGAGLRRRARRRRSRTGPNSAR